MNFTVTKLLIFFDFQPVTLPMDKRVLVGCELGCDKFRGKNFSDFFSDLSKKLYLESSHEIGSKKLMSNQNFIKFCSKRK